MKKHITLNEIIKAKISNGCISYLSKSSGVINYRLEQCTNNQFFPTESGPIQESGGLGGP